MSRLTEWLRSFWLGRLFVELRLGWFVGDWHGNRWQAYRRWWRIARIMAHTVPVSSAPHRLRDALQDYLRRARP